MSSAQPLSAAKVISQQNVARYPKENTLEILLVILSQRAGFQPIRIIHDQAFLSRVTKERYQWSKWRFLATERTGYFSNFVIYSGNSSIIHDFNQATLILTHSNLVIFAVALIF